LGDTRLHYIQRGKGNKKILLIHGNMGSIKWWEPMMDALEDQYAMLAVDLRGYGQSPDGKMVVSLQDHVNDLTHVMKDLDFSPCVVVGHSLGGAVAMQMATSCPDLLTGMVLVDAPSLKGLNGTDYTILETILSNDDMLVASLRMTVVAPVDDTYFSKLVADCLRGKAALISNTRALESLEFQKVASQFTKPVLIVHGELDSLIPVAVAEETATCYPQAKLHIISGVGHNPQIENTPAFVQLLGGFLQSF